MSNASLVYAFQAILVFGQNGSPSHASTPPKTLVQEQATATKKGQLIARLHRLRSDLIQQSLGLPWERAETLADLWDMYDSERMDGRASMHDLHRRINSIFSRPITEARKNAEMRSLMHEYDAIRQRELDVERDFVGDVQRLLSPLQRARFFLLEEEFQKSLKESLLREVSGSK